MLKDLLLCFHPIFYECYFHKAEGGKLFSTPMWIKKTCFPFRGGEIWNKEKPFHKEIGPVANKAVLQSKIEMVLGQG